MLSQQNLNLPCMPFHHIPKKQDTVIRALPIELTPTLRMEIAAQRTRTANHELTRLKGFAVGIFEMYLRQCPSARCVPSETPRQGSLFTEVRGNRNCQHNDAMLD